MSRSNAENCWTCEMSSDASGSSSRIRRGRAASTRARLRMQTTRRAARASAIPPQQRKEKRHAEDRGECADRQLGRRHHDAREQVRKHDQNAAAERAEREEKTEIAAPHHPDEMRHE